MLTGRVPPKCPHLSRRLDFQSENRSVLLWGVFQFLSGRRFLCTAEIGSAVDHEPTGRKGITMNNNEKNVTANEVLENLQYEAEKLSPYATNAMRPAIIRKSLEGRVKAIDAPFCEKVGVSKERLQDWKYNVDTLYNASCEYSRAIGTSQEAKRREELWMIWKRIIKVGEEDALHPNMYIREKDVENLRVIAAESTQEHIDGVGFVPTTRGKDAFRGFIEIRIALRIAGNATLTDTERDTVQDYRKAVKTIRQTRELLFGYVNPKGEQIPSLYDQVESAEADKKALVDVLKKAKTKDADIEKLTKRHDATIKQLNEQIDAAQKRLEKYLKVEKDLREDYKTIVNRLDAIEGTKDAELKPQAPAKNREEVRESLRKKLEELDAEG